MVQGRFGRNCWTKLFCHSKCISAAHTNLLGVTNLLGSEGSAENIFNLCEIWSVGVDQLASLEYLKKYCNTNWNNNSFFLILFFFCMPGGFYNLDAFWFPDWKVVHQSTYCKFEKTTAPSWFLSLKMSVVQIACLASGFIEPSWILMLLFVSTQSYLKEFSFSNANQDDLWTHIQMVLILYL